MVWLCPVAGLIESILSRVNHCKSFGSAIGWQCALQKVKSQPWVQSLTKTLRTFGGSYLVLICIAWCIPLLITSGKWGQGQVVVWHCPPQMTLTIRRTSLMLSNSPEGIYQIFENASQAYRPEWPLNWAHYACHIAICNDTAFHNYEE